MLLVGDDWAEDHHDIEIQDPDGRVLRVARVAEGMAGMARLHELIAEFLSDDDGPEQVVVGIETERGPWVRALVAAGYLVFAVNPKLAARHREVVSLSGAKDDKTDAHTLADMVRTRRHQLRTVAGRFGAGRGGEGAGPGASKPDPGTDPAHAAAAGRAA